mgnify:CR=1 FL=1
MPQALGPLARRLSVPYYEAALPAHDAFHANRVRTLGLRLADELDSSVDRDVLAAAAWFHDIGRPLERSGEIDDHDEWATEEAAELLRAESVEPDRIEAVQHCIRAHSIRSSSPAPETPAAKLLFDADKLDAIGAVGLLRLACIVGERSGRTGEAYAVLDDSSIPGVDTSDRPDVSLLREWAAERLDRLYTEPARELGASRWDFMERFFEQFHGELGVDGQR